MIIKYFGIHRFNPDIYPLIFASLEPFTFKGKFGLNPIESICLGFLTQQTPLELLTSLS